MPIKRRKIVQQKKVDHFAQQAKSPSGTKKKPLKNRPAARTNLLALLSIFRKKGITRPNAVAFEKLIEEKHLSPEEALLVAQHYYPDGLNAFFEQVRNPNAFERENALVAISEIVGISILLKKQRVGHRG